MVRICFVARVWHHYWVLIYHIDSLVQRIVAEFLLVESNNKRKKMENVHRAFHLENTSL